MVIIHWKILLFFQSFSDRLSAELKALTRYQDGLRLYRAKHETSDMLYESTSRLLHNRHEKVVQITAPGLCIWLPAHVYVNIWICSLVLFELRHPNKIHIHTWCDVSTHTHTMQTQTEGLLLMINTCRLYPTALRLRCAANAQFTERSTNCTTWGWPIQECNTK